MAFQLDSLEGISLFLQANGRVIHFERVHVARLELRDARSAVEMLGPLHRSGELVVTNFSTLDGLATACLMLECAEMIVDDLLGEVESRAVDPEHVEGLRRTGAYLVDELIGGDSFFLFVTDVAQAMVTVARSMKRPFHRDFARHHNSLVNLRVAIVRLRDRNVVFPMASAHLPPALGPVVIGLGPVVVGTSPPQPATPAPLLVDQALEEFAPKDEDKAAADDLDAATATVDLDDQAPEEPAPKDKDKAADDDLDTATAAVDLDDQALEEPAPKDENKAAADDLDSLFVDQALGEPADKAAADDLDTTTATVYLDSATAKEGKPAPDPDAPPTDLNAATVKEEAAPDAPPTVADGPPTATPGGAGDDA